MANHPCIGFICGIITTVILAFTIGMPWYFFNATLSDSSKSCEVQFLMSWSTVYCSNTTDCSNNFWGQAFVEQLCNPSQYNWRNGSGNYYPFKTNDGVSNRTLVFNVAIGLTVGAAAASLILTLSMFFLMCGCGGSREIRSFNSLIGFIG